MCLKDVTCFESKISYFVSRYAYTGSVNTNLKEYIPVSVYLHKGHATEYCSQNQNLVRQET